MSNIGIISFRLRADVRAAISGMKAAEGAATAVAIEFDRVAGKYVDNANKIAVWSTSAMFAFREVQDTLNEIDTTTLDAGVEQNINRLKSLTNEITALTTGVSAASSTFSTLTQASGTAFTTIARLAPGAAGAIAALSGPVGIAIGVIGALTAGYMAYNNATEETREKNDDLTNSLREQQAQTSALQSIINTTKITLDEKNRSIEEYNRANGTSIDLIDKQSKNLNTVANQLANVNNELLINIRLEANKERLLENEKRRIEVQDQIIDAQKREQEEINRKAQAILDLNKKTTDLNEAFRGSDSLSRALDLGKAQRSIEKTKKEIEKLEKSLLGIDENSKQYLDTIGQLSSEKQKYNKLLNENAKAIEKEAKAFDVFVDPLQLLQLEAEEALRGVANSFRFVDKPIQEAQEKIRVLENLLTALGASGADVDVARIQAIKDQIEELNVFIAKQKPTEYNVIPPAPEREIIDNYNKAFQDIAVSFSILDNPAQQAREEIKLIEKTLKDMALAGVDANDAFVQKLKQQWASLQTEGEKTWRSIAKEIRSAISVAAGAGRIILALNDNSIAQQRNDLEEYYERERELIENSTLSKAQKAQLEERLEAKMAQKKKELARKEAVSKRNQEMFQTAIAGARAAVQAGPNPAAIAAMVAFTAAQLGIIASRPLPALASGGLAFGPTLALVGDNPGARSNPEVIAPLDKLKQYIVDANGGSQMQGQLVSVIRGDDLHLIMQRQDYLTQRTR
jgi:DNA repair exonuclease SbcCD ATPase subunit